MEMPRRGRLPAAQIIHDGDHALDESDRVADGATAEPERTRRRRTTDDISSQGNSPDIRRAEYVRYQQELALSALCCGVPGAARAALYFLWPFDFVDREAARRLIYVLRHGAADHDSMLEAIQAVACLEPAAEI